MKREADKPVRFPNFFFRNISNNITVEHHRLTVVSDAGAMRTIELTPSVSVRLLDSKLQHEMERYLDLLASTRNQQMRHLTLEAHGTGDRDIRVSYISEVPVWKSTYRIVFPKISQPSETATAILQGWAVVDNTVGSDWDNVQLSLVAGAPQSFVQSLSQPYYTRRPEIGLPASAMLTPQTHESAMADALLAPQQGMPTEQVIINGQAVGGPLRGNSALKSSVNGAWVGSGTGSGSGSGGGIVGGVGGGMYHAAAAPSVQDETGSANTTGFDDYLEYSLPQPITIHKNQSALVPVLQTNVQAERVTLWSWTQPQPLRAIWLTNTSNLTLDRGSFSIFEKRRVRWRGSSRSDSRKGKAVVVLCRRSGRAGKGHRRI